MHPWRPLFRGPVTFSRAYKCSMAAKVLAKSSLAPSRWKGSLVEWSRSLLSCTFDNLWSSTVCNWLPSRTSCNALPPHPGCLNSLDGWIGLLHFCFSLKSFPLFSRLLATEAQTTTLSCPLLPPSLTTPLQEGFFFFFFIFCLVLVEEKSSGFRLKPPTLIHGQAPSAGRCPPWRRKGEWLSHTLPGFCTAA